MKVFLSKGLVILFLFSLINTYAVQIEVDIDETSELVQLPNEGGYSLVANGVLSIYNPSALHKVYEFDIPLSLDSFIGISKVNVGSNNIVVNNISINLSNFMMYTNYTNYTAYLASPGYKNWTITNTSIYILNSDKFDFSFDKISGYLIEPNETIRVGYQIFGLLDYDIYATINDNDQTILDYYTNDYDFLSRLNMKLDKMEREDYVYNSSGELVSSPLTNTTPRMVTTYIENPTDFDYLTNYHLQNQKLE